MRKSVLDLIRSKDETSGEESAIVSEGTSRIMQIRLERAVCAEITTFTMEEK